jgi:drug/metabolite transporter (DMT)-like permease
MVASAFFFSLMSLLVKVVGQRLPSQEIVLVRGVITLFLSYWLLRRARLSPWGDRRALLVLRGLLGFGALSCFYFSLTRLPLAEATVIQYLNPLFTAILAAWLLGERAGAAVAVGTMLGLLGTTLVARPAVLFGELAAPLDLAAVGIAMAGAALSAGAYVTVRYLGATEHPLVIVFYFPLVTVPATLPLVAGNWTWPTATEWSLLLGIGITTQIAQVYITRGLALEPAGRAMTVGYTQVVFAAFWGALVFADFPGILVLAGAVLVMAGALIVAVNRPTAAR